MSLPRRKINTGFTLVELLVTISIFVILTGVVLFSQSKFNSTILLTNLAYDTALTIRQAQTYGINIKEFGTNQFVPYGVHFDISANKSFILFADTDSNNLFTGSDLAHCVSAVGCVNRYNIKSGNSIVALCKGEVLAGGKICKTGDNIIKLDVVFKRPNPDAHMITNIGDTEYTVATIILGNSDGNVRKVRIQSNGLIQIDTN